ncbi:DNA topoisomerase IV [Tessaracoccus lapidicaptus]|uniref:DNA topoisomerase (ATP-hydrolyzing) n=1 Tax=Tessaracoccus lapidicaptus TaxID=1427523 RepID=A0A1C0AK00_9ACTN|nr:MULTISPECIES: DNA topoisomerase (ATP-hydrolyzing) [Tessaracoccus]AQX14546.1 DNA topoisomerase IV [Tessaracoccus sp. T2.5-30]OCL32941.1 DNA topoisomerase IV [Tessaracoccus lapidicaptus]VEP38565.1 DNA gyrase subunit A [Tessaracoccus lapidicaptus]
MAKPTIDDEATEEEHILDVDVTEEMETSFLEYAYSVIYSRALPDARDGLKPVQRRILYSMDDMGIRPDRGHVKCARVVGQVMGQLHPHGDGAIYDALVRIAQPWAMRLPLVDGHGNFGSLDAGPAAMRYTECRMAPPALAMTRGLDEDTVDFKPNYDGKESEPSVLPAAFPNLLVNGATGIAVGMATNIAPHNLIEVVAALRQLLRNPDTGLDELMRHIPGPDFPTGGKIVGLDGIRDAYATGRGTLKLRATTRIEKVSPRRMGIVVTELPYMVGPEKIIEQIKKGVDDKKLVGIADVKDLTDLANGTRLVIEVKNGINPDALLQQLFKVTKLEDTFAINAVALVEGQPRTLSLKDMLEVYLEHRLDVILRRTRFQLGKAEDRLHLVRGLIIAIADIDDVIAIIRSSDDAAEARGRLIGAFDLTETQATYILDMQLRRLTRFSTIELEKEAAQLIDTIAGLREIIDDDQVLRRVVGDELSAVAKQFGTPRRTVLLASSGVAATAAAPLELADDPCWVLLSGTGLVARTDACHELPVEGRSAHDVIVARLATTAHSEFGVITNRGRLLRCRAIELPTVPLTASAPGLQGGSLAHEMWPLEQGESPLGLTTLGPDEPGLALGTAMGVVKRVNPEVLSKDSWDVIALRDGDEVVGAVQLDDPHSHLAFVSSDAQLLHFPASSVRPQGRSGAGMAGIKLAPDARAVWFGAVRVDTDDVVTVAGSSTSLPGTETGAAKVTPLSEYPAKGRATGGVRAHRFLKGEDTLLIAAIGPRPMVASAASGSPVDLPSTPGRRDGSGLPLAQPVTAVAGRGTRTGAGPVASPTEGDHHEL